MFRGLNISTRLRRVIFWYNLLPSTRIAGDFFFALVGAQRTKVKMKNLVLEMEDQALYRFLYIDISLSIWEVI